ncbi:unnamed protein product [Allacma fusca]|uniref:Uncharacterized protein n=1 Tax=Allacma fusca TaxID=39272 RepID=A0A8J2JUD1_9HEXA|nr:unnamed protein product [Allacma fusca]
MSFAVVVFLKTKEVEAVPKTWLLEDDGKTYCFWPNFKKIQEVYDAAQSEGQPDRKNWKRFAVSCFEEFDSYDLAVQEIGYYLEHSDYEAKKSVKRSIPQRSTENDSRRCISPAESSSTDESPSEVVKKFTFAPVESQFPHDKVLSRTTLAPPRPPTPVASTSSKFISTDVDRNQKPVSISPRANVTSGNENSVRNDPQPIVNIQPILAEIRGNNVFKNIITIVEDFIRNII